MKKIEFSSDERRAIIGRIQRYFSDELDQTIGNMPAEFLLQFFTDEIGAYYYNRGLYDAQGVVKRKFDDIADEVFALEQREAGTR